MGVWCSCSTPCSFPHGIGMIIPILILTGGYIMSVIVVNSCSLIRVEIGEDGYFDAGSSHEVGLFGYTNSSDSQCALYIDPEDDGSLSKWISEVGPYFNAAQAMGIIACTLGGWILLITLCTPCMACTKDGCCKFFAFLLFVAFLAQALVFLIFQSSDCKPDAEGAIGGDDCSFTTHTYFIIGATLAWLVGSITLCIFPKPVDE